MNREEIDKIIDRTGNIEADLLNKKVIEEYDYHNLMDIHIQIEVIIRELESQLKQTRSDLLEMAETLVGNMGQVKYCGSCDTFLKEHEDLLNHKENCIVLKAEQIIKELSC